MSGLSVLIMKDIDEKILPELDDDDRAYITNIFDEIIVPKLRKLNARLGNLCCGFAGDTYKNWNLNFRSVGSDFVIVEFEYDEDCNSMDLDL